MTRTVRILAWVFATCATSVITLLPGIGTGLATVMVPGIAYAAADTPPGASKQAGEIPIARSALLSLSATTTDDTVELHIRRVRDQTPVSSDDVTVTVDGKSESVKRGSDGSYLLGADELRGDGARALEVMVPHDGIRELLSGNLTAPQTSTASDLFRNHKQMGWWVLNVVIVLIAAIAISRRKG